MNDPHENELIDSLTDALSTTLRQLQQQVPAGTSLVILASHGDDVGILANVSEQAVVTLFREALRYTDNWNGEWRLVPRGVH